MDGYQITMAIVLVFFIFMQIPRIKAWYANDDRPRGDTSQWMNYAALMAAVVFFVMLLISFVRGG